MVDREAVIVEAVRTPMGKRGGMFAAIHPRDLLARTITALVDRTGINPDNVDDHIAGCVGQVGEQALNIARNAWLTAFPDVVHVPAVTIDRQCGSSQQAIHFAAQGILAGSYGLVIASGVESMSRVPMGSSAVLAPRTLRDFLALAKAFRRGDMVLPPFAGELMERFGGKLIHQGISAELIAHRYGISRDAQDDFAYRSHVRAAHATRANVFAREKVGWFAAPAMHGGTDVMNSADEGIRMKPDREKIGALPPVFRNAKYEKMFPGELEWTVTAGNSSQISDGAAAVLLASRAVADRLGLPLRARFVSFAVSGSDPIEMLMAVVPATRKALARAGNALGRYLAITDMDLVEINEAFASVVLAWKRALHIPDDWFEHHVNVNGGAIAHGHPLGATGAILMTKLVHELERRGGRFGLQVMCEGGGMANATIIERIS